MKLFKTDNAKIIEKCRDMFGVSLPSSLTKIENDVFRELYVLVIYLVGNSVFRLL